MELTVLGRSGRYPEKGGGTSAYLLRCDDITLLLDMGSGAISRFSEIADISDIDGIIFSHLHGDHMADFLPFVYMVSYLKSRLDKAIDVYLPSEPSAIYDIMTVSHDHLEYHTIDDSSHVNIKGVDIDFMRVKHPVPTYAMKISYKGRTLVYTGDTTHFDGIERIFDGADVVLADACILDKDWTINSPHISIKELATLTLGKRLIMSHLPDNEKEISMLYDEAHAINENSEVAILMKTYTI